MKLKLDFHGTQKIILKNSSSSFPTLQTMHKYVFSVAFIRYQPPILYHIAETLSKLVIPHQPRNIWLPLVYSNAPSILSNIQVMHPPLKSSVACQQCQWQPNRARNAFWPTTNCARTPLYINSPRCVLTCITMRINIGTRPYVYRTANPNSHTHTHQPRSSHLCWFAFWSTRRHHHQNARASLFVHSNQYLISALRIKL